MLQLTSTLQAFRRTSLSTQTLIKIFLKVNSIKRFLLIIYVAQYYFIQIRSVLALFFFLVNFTRKKI